jgi:hypothetical protein
LNPVHVEAWARAWALSLGADLGPELEEVDATTSAKKAISSKSLKNFTRSRRVRDRSVR